MSLYHSQGLFLPKGSSAKARPTFLGHNDRVDHFDLPLGFLVALYPLLT